MSKQTKLEQRIVEKVNKMAVRSGHSVQTIFRKALGTLNPDHIHGVMNGTRTMVGRSLGKLDAFLDGFLSTNIDYIEEKLVETEQELKELKKTIKELEKQNQIL